MKLLLLFIICVASVQSTHVNLEMTKLVEESPQGDTHRRARRAVGACENSDVDTSILKEHTDVHIFANDSNPSISIIWTGTEGNLLALTSMNIGFIRTPSKLYHSHNYGRSFKDISIMIQNDQILKNHGMLVNPLDSAYVILVGARSAMFGSYGHEVHTKTYVTTDAGKSFHRVVCPFSMNSETLIFSHKNPLSIAVLSSDDYSMWISHDFGLKWSKWAEYVLQIRWDPVEADTLYYMADPTKSMSNGGFHNELYRVTTSAMHTSSQKIAEHVYSFGVQGGFLFMSIEYLNHNGSRVMHVSKDQGATWKAAQIPLIDKEQFYSLLDMSEDMVFIHVDSTGNGGDGIIFTSDERGVIYSKSLEHHLYPDLGSVTDFFKVESLLGVYITSQLHKADNTIHSMITYNKGGDWQKIDAPADSKCPATEKECRLQIHILFSKSKGVRSPEFPKSSVNAPGIIIAHGNVGDALNFNPPDVYISTDGGYSWIQPPELKGPHFYGIGDSGGILYAVQAYKATNVVKFSVDEGQCWHEHKFVDSAIIVTGVSIQPGSQTTLLGLWGWDKNGDGAWRSVTVDFSPFLKKPCEKSDYETWVAHESNTLYDDSCLLGAKVIFTKRKKGRVCINGKDHVNEAVINPCECKKTDFLCDYGYTRDDSMECVRDNTLQAAHMDICVDGKEDTIETQGYRRIPGDKCAGGFEPTTKIISLHKSCLKTEKELDFGVDPNSFSRFAPPSKVHTDWGLVIGLTCTIVALVCVLVYLVRKRRSISLRMKYVPLATEPDTAENSTPTGDNGLIDFGAVNGVGSDSLSYHDDSDEDLLVT